MFLLVRPAVAPAVSLFLALLTVLAPGVVDIAQAQTVDLRLSSTMLAENGGTARIRATVAPVSTTPFTLEISAMSTADSRPSTGRVTVSGTTLNFAAGATHSTGTVTITAIDNDGHTSQLRGGARVTVSGTVTGGTSVTDPSDRTLAIVEDDGTGSATDMTRPEALRWRSTVDGDRLVLVFSEALKSDRTPSATHFSVGVNGRLFEPSGNVEVTVDKVILILSEPVGSGARVFLRYNPPTHANSDIDLTQALQDLAGNPVYPIVRLPVFNVAVPRVELVLTPRSTAENGGTATVTATVSPASTTPFTVEVSAVATVDSDPSMGRVTVSGTTLNFAANATMSTGTVTITAIDNDGHTPQLRGGVSVTVSGTVTGGTSVTDPSDQTLAIVEDDGIGTATDMTRPEAIWPRSTVDGDRMVLVFTEALKSDRTPSATHFRVGVNGGLSEHPVHVGVTGHKVILTLRESVGSDATISFGYNPPTHANLDIDLTRALQDLSGIPVYRIIGIPVVNVTVPRVELVLTPGSIDENGGESIVTARVTEASMTPFTVTVAATPVAPATATDFTVSSNKVLSFAPGATECTGEVTIAAIDNEELEGHLAVTVSGTVTGRSDVSKPVDETLRIRDDERPALPVRAPAPARARANDPVYKAWLARFGRGAVGSILDGIRERLTAPREAGLRGKLAGQAFNGAARPDGSPGMTANPAAPVPFRSRRVTDRDLLTGTAFALTGATGGGGSFALWGRGGHSVFDGRDGAIRLDGTVTAAALGTDYSARCWLAGLAFSHSRGEGSYRSGDETGKLATSLTGAYPYVRYALTDRLSLWGVAGHGRGTQRMTQVTPARQPAMEADMSLSMAGTGARGLLFTQRHGLRLALATDAFYMRTTSEARAGLKAADADVSRLRLRLEGAWVQPFRGGATLTPSLEIGARHDGGDAETGFGADVGGGIVLADPGSGLLLRLNARGLLVHGASGFREWGVSGVLRYDPNPVSERGLSFTLAPSWGAASTGGADALIGRETLAGLSRTGMRPRVARLGAELSYGFPVFARRFTGTPYLGLGLTTQGGRHVRIGWRLAAVRRDDVDMTFGLEAARREDAGGDPEHTASLRLTARR